MVAEAIDSGPVVAAFASWLTSQGTSAGAIGSKYRNGAGDQATAFRVGGTDDAALVQLDCWAATEAAAEALAAELATAVNALAPSVVSGVHLKGARVIGVRSVADEAAARYVCDIVLTTAS